MNRGALTTPSSVSDVNRRILTLIVALIPIVVFGVLLAVVTVPYVSLGPGPAFDTLGEVDGKPVVDIKGTQTHPTTGHLDMTTVSQRDDLSLAEALTLWLSGQEQLMPRDLVYPPGTSREDVDKANDADFKESEHNAEFAALGYLKYPEAVTVVTLTDPGPSVGKLQAGDAIHAVDGKPVATVEQFTSYLKTTKPGQNVAVDFHRKNAPPGVAHITLGHHPKGDYGFLGEVDFDRVVFDRAPRRRQHVPIKVDTMPPVEIVAMYGGADGSLIQAAVDHGAKGLVIEALGLGNVNQPMFAAIKQAIGKGIPVVIASRVPNGRVLPNYGFDGGGKTLVDAGAVMGDNLTPQKARILLMLLLQNGVGGQKDLQAAFSR